MRQKLPDRRLLERTQARHILSTVKENGGLGLFTAAFDLDFHALNSDQVAFLLEAADHLKYKAPANANGSRARYFYAYLQRLARGPRK
jgi:hypothetical protein